jgi:hypothetical protein
MCGDDVTLAGEGSVVRACAVQRLRTQVAVEVSPRLWEYFDQVAPIAVVVADIVDRWRCDRVGRVPLVGPGGFAAAYVAAVERDAAGRPWAQLCRRDAQEPPVVDESYLKRVWTHHVGWLQRLHPFTETVVPDRLPDGPVGELVVERLRTEAAIDVAAAVHEWLGDDPARVGVVVADVVARWLALPAAERATVALTGVEQFAQQYVARVLYADPAEDAYRPEFCPPEGQALDWDAYARAVWTHHLDQVVGVR